jgi:ATP adenylyltransferase
MEHLWAPWRMQFIEELRDAGSGCILCELAQTGDDAGKLVLFRNEHLYVVMNRYPYTNGHLMIVPHRHVDALSALSRDEQTSLMSVCSHSVDILGEALNAEGFNCGMNLGQVAGAGIKDHVHLHVVPRWCGDANFMPIIGDARSMPEYLEATHQRLLPGFEKLKADS